MCVYVRTCACVKCVGLRNDTQGQTHSFLFILKFDVAHHESLLFNQILETMC